MTLGDAARLGRRAGRNVGRPISRAGSLRMRASGKNSPFDRPRRMFRRRSLAQRPPAFAAAVRLTDA
ncbi:hypothetical protein [Burkholderia pseudomallei]|uniref:hypothetical protein n=1 Tax=Burkholderia pseudomallei TaxID=28450 RepID=UPI001E593564|nr:hypothetical protein [Burkholderia pseudomallei]